MDRRIVNWVIATAVVALLAFLVACGTAHDGDDDGNDDEDIAAGSRDVGVVVIDERTVADDTAQVGGNGFFVRFDEDVPADLFDAPWSEVVGTCQVFGVFDVDPSDPIDMFPGIVLPDDLGITFLGAGDTIAVRSGGAAFLELERSEAPFGEDTIIAYGSGGPVQGPLLVDLTLSVPGDDYPSVANAGFPDTPAFALTAPAEPGSPGAVGIDTTFSWSGATNDAATIVTIDLMSADVTTFVSCVAADTGSFALPAATVTELGGTFSGSVLAAGRTGTRVHAVGDARLMLAVTRSRSYLVPMVPFPDLW